MSGILGIGAGGDTGFYGFPLEQSLRFNDGDSAHLSKLWGSAGNKKTFTISMWFKRSKLGARQDLVSFAQDVPILIDGDDEIQCFLFGQTRVQTNRRFRDTSAWYHIVLEVDSTQATESDRINLYVNGTKETDLQSETYPSQNLDANIYTSSLNMTIGRTYGGSNYFDGYMAEVHFLDGVRADADQFGETKNGIWIPKQYTGSHDTNGFKLAFQDSSALGDDTSGNGNDFTATNLAASDQMLDTPTNNFATFSFIDSHVASGFSQTFSEGNLQVGAASGSHKQGVRSTIGTKTMNFYYELCSKTAGTTNYQIGVATSSAVVSSTSNAGIYNKAQSSGSSGDIIMVAYSADANAMWTGRNGTWDNSATVSEIEAGTTTNATQTSIDPDEHIHAMYLDQASSFSGTVVANFGQDGTFAGNKTAQGNTDDNGNGDFFYAPPSGYFALCTANLPDPDIDPSKGETPDEYFNTVLYSGTGASQSITGVGFQPDFVWIKRRSAAAAHALWDNVRGTQKWLLSDGNNAEITTTDGLSSFDSDGFTLGADATYGSWNNSGTHVAWNWKAGGTAVSNTDGTVNSSVSANTEAGFSIVTFTGGAAGYTVGHGLSQAPEIVFTFNRTDSAGANYVFTTVIDGSIDYLNLDSNTAKNNDPFSMPAFTSSVFSLDNDYGMDTGDNCVAYCFHSVEGYSKIGSYTGNADANGTFVYTGFRPAFVMTKRAGSSTGNWPMFDNKRDVDNVVEHIHFADLSDDELSPFDRMDFVSNGFKLRDTGSGVNNSDTILYMAFAEQPFKYANAR
jgi:hypothetical protein